MALLKRVYNNILSSWDNDVNLQSMNMTTNSKYFTIPKFSKPLLLRYRYPSRRNVQLEKEKHSLSATRINSELPYDILCLIFEHLDFSDLLQCTCVCQAWYNFMIYWPVFWQKHAKDMPQIPQSTLNSLIRRQTNSFQLDGPIPFDVLHAVLLFLADIQSLKALHFNRLILAESNIFLMEKVIRSPALKQLEFLDCSIPNTTVIQLILESCQHLAHISFSQSHDTAPCYNSERPTKITFPNVEFSFLTYLKLSVDNYMHTDNEEIPTDRLAGILCRCPQLIHLFLDSGGSIDQGFCIRNAIKYCPQLKNLVVSNKAVMPTTIVSDIKQDESMVKRGLRRLVLTGGAIKWQAEDVAPIFKKAHKSLELFYAHYIGFGAIGPHSLYKLASYRTSNLREIRLSTETGARKNGSSAEVTITKALAYLFAGCPLLEVISIIDTLGIKYNPFSYLYVDDHVLTTIAGHCRLLHHLQVMGRRHHTDTGLFGLAKLARLTYLEIDMERKNVLPVVERFPSLQYLHVRNDDILYQMNGPISKDDHQTADKLLRGGTFVID
ncbi:hypothetical protein BJV82DRAFT_625373 [Fennellomyces sp. T-0311]|nr:hypothetical protein BJV82DRAFT_625373 [Fennellomyces sp. T-0311]